MPADVKLLLEKFPSILRMDDVMPNPSYRVEPYIHTGRHPPVLQRPAASTQKKVEFKHLESPGIVCPSTSPWVSPLHMVPK